MKRYVLFQWNHYDAFGGLSDIKGDYDTLADAQAAARTYWDVSEIVDRDSWDVVWERVDGEEVGE